MALELNDSIFEEKVLKSDKPVLVDFWAEWCGPCRMVGPIIDELSKEFEGKAVVGKIDVDANQEFAAKYGVRSLDFGIWLLEQGITKSVWNLVGGIDAWSTDVDQSIPRY